MNHILARKVKTQIVSEKRISKTVTVGLSFESGQLFVRAYLEGFHSEGDAKAATIRKPILVKREGWLWVECAGRVAKMVCSSYECYCGEDCGGADECGQWQDGMSRGSFDDYVASRWES